MSHRPELALAAYRLPIPAMMLRRVRGSAVIRDREVTLDTEIDLAWPLHSLVRRRVIDVVRFETDALARLERTDAFRIAMLNRREANKRFWFARTPDALALYNAEQSELLVYGTGDRERLASTIEAALDGRERGRFARAMRDASAVY